MNTTIFIVTVTIIFIAIVLIYRFYRHYSLLNLGMSKFKSHTNKVLAAEAEKIKRRNSTAKLLTNMRYITSSIPFFKETEQKTKTLKYYAKRLNIVWNDNTLSADDLIAIRSIVCLIYIVIVCILTVLVNLYLMPLLVLYKFPAFCIDFAFEQEIKTHNELLLKDFRDFYAEFFYNYRHKANRGVKVTDVAMRFYNRANPETKLLIDNLRADAIQSEEYALDQMKDLFRVVKIHRMADQIKMIIMGKTTNTDAMEGFKKEIEDEFRANKRKELELKKAKSVLAQGSAWAILTEIVIAFCLSAMIQK